MTTDVSTIIDNQQAYANTWAAQAQEFINQISNLADVVFPINIPLTLGFGRSGITDSAKAELLAQKPPRPTIPTISATAPDAPTFDFTAIIPVSVLDFTQSAPVLSLPSAPSSTLPTVPVAPSITSPVIPDAPTVVIPDAPTVTTPVLPVTPTIQLPYFTSVLPVDDMVAPTYTFAFAEQAYSSALLDATKAKLLDNMLNGGYGIEPADETALWERARAREYLTSQQSVEEIFRNHASRGFPLPPGDVFIATERAQQELTDRVSAVNREITLKRSELYVDNRKFTIQQAKELENILINFHNSIQERALNAAKATLEAAIRIFDALVARYNARIAAYQASAQVFEAQTRAAMTQIEIYRTQIDAARLTVDIQRIAVDAYNAQLNGIQAIVGIFRTRMEAASIQANIERLRLDTFRGLVDAYAQQVQAKVAEFGMYKAQIEGETAKITAFESEVRAYSAQVGAAKVKADIQVANLQAEVEQSRTRLTGYQAAIEQFRATLTAQVETLNATTNVYRADISAFATSVDAIKSAYTLEVEELRASQEWNVKAVDAAIHKAQVNLMAQQASSTLRLSASTTGANIYTAAQQAVLGSITTLAAAITSS